MIPTEQKRDWAAEALAKRTAPPPWHASLCFIQYSSEKSARLHKGFDLLEILEYEDLLARAENSGCEGTYVEVAIWSACRQRWERFAFEKFFGGEIKEFPDLRSYETAKMVADFINERQGTAASSFIHNLPSFEGMLDGGAQ
jgi:hypothetical protein